MSHVVGHPFGALQSVSQLCVHPQPPCWWGMWEAEKAGMPVQGLLSKNRNIPLLATFFWSQSKTLLHTSYRTENWIYPSQKQWIIALSNEASCKEGQVNISLQFVLMKMTEHTTLIVAASSSGKTWQAAKFHHCTPMSLQLCRLWVTSSQGKG